MSSCGRQSGVIDHVGSETSVLVGGTELSNTDVSTAPEGLLTAAAQLALGILDAVLGGDLRALRSLPPVVARGVGVLRKWVILFIYII